MGHQLIEGRETSLGALPVRRVLPYRHQRSVGPFVFFDEMGPVQFSAGEGIDVAPHPHIGLSTLTYMLEGGMMHRDSLGSDIEILPGAVNWMTAGHGVTHSERSSQVSRGMSRRVHGLQIWVALPPESTEIDPFFEHHPGETLPEIGPDISAGAATLKLVAGSAFGETSPVTTFSKLFYLDASWGSGGDLTLPADLGERAVYLLEGELSVDAMSAARGSLLVLEDGSDITMTAGPGTRAILLGGASLPQTPLMHWNYVAYRPEAIEAAKRRWADGEFPPVPHDPGKGR
ncbi:MAG: pirin family protein [Planctomycetota bacterium]